MKKYLILLSCILLSASCVKEEFPSSGSFTLTVRASKSDSFKSLTLNGSTLSASWTQGDQVSVYNVTRGAELEGALSAQSSGSATTLRGELTGTIGNGDVLKLKFLSPNYSSQAGTLAYIAQNCDYAEATVTVKSKTGGNLTLKESSASFQNKQAVVKFSLKDNISGKPALNASRLIVTAGESTITVTPASASSSLFVAIPGFSGKDVALSANVGFYCYAYSKAGAAFTDGHYYEIDVELAKQYVDLGTLTSAFTAVDGDVLKGTLSQNVRVSIAAGATVTLENATINRSGNSCAGLTCLGDATLNLVGNNTVNGGTLYAGIRIGGTGTTLTIQGEGSLSATGGLQSAGIGISRSWSAGNVTGGNIVINSGTITARGYPSQWGAGIGTGASYSSNVVMGDITINGGTVTAIGGNDGSAGIGTTYTYVGSGGSTIGNITINGGTVIATGNANATAIGTGYTASGVTGRVGEITINGGNVTATCGGSGPTVIGQGTNGTCGDIYIAMGSSIPTLTLNNPHISGTPIEVLNFLNAGSGQSVITPDMYGLENIAFDTTDYWFESFSGYRFGCLTEQQFRFEPLN